MEGAFGADLSSVKLYESQAVESAGAQAIAQGNRIAFAPGKLDFASRSGQALLGHEISHIVSQARGEVSESGFLNDSSLESRADQEGMMAAMGAQIYSPATAEPISVAGAQGFAAPMQAKKEKNSEYYNNRLSKMFKSAGNQGVSKLAQGKGGWLKQKRYNEAMNYLNGTMGHEISEENMASIYDSGGFGRKWIQDRVLKNMAMHIRGVHDESVKDGSYERMGNLEYMSYLQNRGVREGNGGRIGEYGKLARVVSRGVKPAMIKKLTAPEPDAASRAGGSSAAYKEAAAARGAEVINAMPGIFENRSDDIIEFNDQFQRELAKSVPAVFGEGGADTGKIDATTSDARARFVSKSFLLRGLLPALATDEGIAGRRQVDKDGQVYMDRDNVFAKRSLNQILSAGNKMMTPTGTDDGGDTTQMLKDLLTSRLRDFGGELMYV